MELAKFKRVFENKILQGWGLLCEKVSIVSVKAKSKSYRFLRLDGINGSRDLIPLDEQQERTFLYLITENRFLRRDKTLYKKDKTNLKNHKAVFTTVKFAPYEIEQTATDPDPSTCIMVELNHTNHVANLNNISVHSFCNIENMDELMRVIETLLKKVKWNGKVTLSDNAKKNGVRVAVYYMRKHKDDPTKFSKYQDYGFNVRSESIPALSKIKKGVLTLTDEAATKKYGDKISDLLLDMYRT
jgi:hypothetical protein